MNPTSAITIDSHNFYSNKANRYGGSVYYYESVNTRDSVLTINKATGSTNQFYYTSASNSGGLFYIYTAKSLTLTISTADLRYSSAGVLGGGFYIDSVGLSTVTMTGCYI